MNALTYKVDPVTCIAFMQYKFIGFEYNKLCMFQGLTQKLIKVDIQVAIMITPLMWVGAWQLGYSNDRRWVHD